MDNKMPANGITQYMDKSAPSKWGVPSPAANAMLEKINNKSVSFFMV